MGGKRIIQLCPQHADGAAPSDLAYLHRSCPACMKYLASHPREVSKVRHNNPGIGPQRSTSSALVGLCRPRPGARDQ